MYVNYALQDEGGDMLSFSYYSTEFGLDPNEVFLCLSISLKLRNPAVLAYLFLKTN